MNEHYVRHRVKELERAKLKRQRASAKWRFKRYCAACNKEFMPYVPFQVCCTPKCTKTKIWRLKAVFPIEHKAWSLGANLVMGAGKREKISKLLNSSIGRPCVYCGTLLTLNNVSLDHKEPYASNKIRRCKLKNISERIRLDHIDNIHLICKLCNTMKGNFSDSEFTKLLAFLASEVQIKEKLFRRFKIGIRAFK